MSSDVSRLCDAVVEAEFAAFPSWARYFGDHRRDGELGPVGAEAGGRRLTEIDQLLARIQATDSPGLSRDDRIDLETARHRLMREAFELRRLRSWNTDPRWGLNAGADVWSYVARPYAPAPERAAALARHLRDLPEYLDEAERSLDPELPAGPRAIAVESAGGYADFLERDVLETFGDGIDAVLRAQLATAAAAAAGACRRFGDTVERRPERSGATLGSDGLTAFLEAQEAIEVGVPELRRIADAELSRLEGVLAEVAGRIAGPWTSGDPVPSAIETMEADHPSAASLLDETAASLDRLRRFWSEGDALTVPDGVCEVRPSPPFRAWASAMFESPGPLSPPGLPSIYFITAVQPDWNDRQAEEWLRSLNRSLLENIAVHEVYPGHFVHSLHAECSGSLIRRTAWSAGFGEGWAHYTEELAIEHGLAEGRPLLHLAQVQDALLRACRFRGSLMLHTEGATVEDVTRLFMERCRMPRFPAEREARRGGYDPLYLLYCYGKLEIRRWREAASKRPGYTERGFHDTLLDSGCPPLGTLRELTLRG